jgi:aryl-alcohol dehydrogenase-like predicted oxidoreductase
MHYRELGRTGIKVSAIGFGAWAIGGTASASGAPLGWGKTNDEESLAAIRRARDLGVTFFDTSDSYGFGRSESLLGIVLSGKRESFVIGTKYGVFKASDGNMKKDFSRRHIFHAVDGSLKRLRTDYIDLYQVHWPDAGTPQEETAGALVDLKKQGKILAIGVSNYSIPEMVKFKSLAPLASAQPPLNLFEQRSLAEVIPWCQRNGVATLTYGALCRGLLTGTIDEHTEFSGDDLRKDDPKFQQPRFGQYLKAVRLLDRYAHERYGKGVLPLAVRWVLEQPTAPIALWGARHPSELSPVDDLFGWTLDEEALSYISEVLRESIPEAIGSEFMAPPPSEVP